MGLQHDFPNTQCFLIEPTGRARRWLRRFTYTHEGKCPAHGEWGHDAMVPIEDAPVKILPDGCYDVDAADVPHEDHRWPRGCECGYVFAEGDQWQVHTQRLYRRADTGEEMTLSDAPAGAMWDAVWDARKGQDGRSLYLKLPTGGEWAIDGGATNGPGWTRTGEPPLITATPSIGHLDKDGKWLYHGWLRNGELVDA